MPATGATRSQRWSASGHRAVLIDSRGHGRSTGMRPYTYQLDGIRRDRGDGRLHLERAALVGWSDGACTALILAGPHPSACCRRLVLRLQHGPQRHQALRSYPDRRPLLCPPRRTTPRSLATPTISRTSSKPSAHADEANRTTPPAIWPKIRVPVTIVQSEHDEFIKPEHSSLPGRKHPRREAGDPGRRHPFAPLQRPAVVQRSDAGDPDRLPPPQPLPPPIITTTLLSPYPLHPTPLFHTPPPPPPPSPPPPSSPSSPLPPLSSPPPLPPESVVMGKGRNRRGIFGCLGCRYKSFPPLLPPPSLSPPPPSPLPPLPLGFRR